MTVSRRDIALEVARDQGIAKGSAYAVMNSVLVKIRQALERGDSVELRKFGVFKLIQRKAAIRQDPRNAGVTLEYPAHRRIKFFPNKVMLRTVIKTR